MSETVTLYSSPTCSSCKEARAYLTQQGVTFRDVNVSADSNGLDELIKLTSGRRVVPVIAVGDRWMVGFDKGQLARWLKG
jgi:glutaredoxin 3